MVTLTVQNSANFVRPYLKNQPIYVNGQEPGIFAGNLVLQTILAPPFRWPFNRRSFQFPTQTGLTDYPVPIPDFGFIETQWISDSTGKNFALNGAISLGKDSTQSRPTLIAPQYNDNQGTITFRVKNTPDAVYTVAGDYQRSPGLISSPASMWDVVPDYFAHVYNLGFLAFLSLLVNDSRFPVFERWFLARILSLQDGLDDQARDLFLSNWMNMTRTVMRSQAATQQGTAGRGT
jgi:hypothetical protein